MQKQAQVSTRVSLAEGLVVPGPEGFRDTVGLVGKKLQRIIVASRPVQDVAAEACLKPVQAVHGVLGVIIRRDAEKVVR